MYSWGGDTSKWRGSGKYSFDSARKPYLDKLATSAKARGGRSYARSSTPDMKLVDALGKEISSDSENIIVVGVDVTGSMSEWPGEIFDRLPLFYQTLSQYRPDLEVCFAAIGDAHCDDYPLQVNHFGKGVSLEDNLKALGCEGGGGGQVSETYELFGYFMNEHCKIPNAKSPFLFMFGDEKFYNTINPDQVKHYIGDTVQNELDSTKMWRNLMQKFNLFYLQKPYGGGYNDSTTKEIKEHWAKAIGPQRVIDLPSMERAVDVAMGIVAKHWGQYGNFTKSMGARHDSSAIDAVAKSIRFIPNDPNGPGAGASHMLTVGNGKVSKRLD